MGLLSEKHGFAFIHVMKSGGTSVKAALSDRATPFSELTGFKQYVIQEYAEWFYKIPNINHAPAIALQSFLGAEKWASLQTFAIVRNPWDWIASLYVYIRRNKNHVQHRYVKELTFEEFVAFECKTRRLTQSDFLCNDNGEMLINKLFKLEEMDAELPGFLNTLLGEEVTMARKNVSERAHYRDIHTPRTRNLVENCYGADIERFEYAY